MVNLIYSYCSILGEVVEHKGLVEGKSHNCMPRGSEPGPTSCFLCIDRMGSTSFFLLPP